MTSKLDDIDALLSGLFDETLRQRFERRLHELGTTQTAVQKLLKIERKTMNGILDATQKRANFSSFHKLAVFLNMPTEDLIKSHVGLLEKKHVDAKSPADTKKFIRENFDLAVLRKAGFINDVTDFDAIEKRITSYFGFRSIFEYKKRGFDTAFWAGAIVPKKTETRDFWLTSAKVLASKLENPYYYDRQELVKYFPQIRWNSTNVEYGLINVIKALYKLGITVIFQKSFSSLHLRGATFAVDGQPCIALTDYKGFYPTLWHCLIHELYHVLFDWEEIKNNNYHVTEDSDGVLTIEPKEAEADDFAREYMFSKNKLDEISIYMRDAAFVREVAYKNNVHHSVIYAYYAFENESIDRMAWPRLRREVPLELIKKAVQRIDVGWDRTVSIDETVKRLKFEIYN